MSLVALLGPLALLLAARWCLARPFPREGIARRVPEGAALAALASGALALLVLLEEGPSTSPLLGLLGAGLSVRLDAVSVTMLLLVGLVGWAVLRFSATYLDGEPRQGAFMGGLCLALAAVLLFVQAGNLVMLLAAWVGMGAAVHRLLLFFPERVAARRAARKKALSVRAGSLLLLGAVLVLAIGYGTLDVAAILAAARAGEAPDAAAWAAILLAGAALLKSAQLPFHGWLTEVMEAPTPVSALLHAGVVNAGGFLVIRFADVFLLAPGVLAALALVGGLSALLGGLVMLTQPAAKTSLAWSTLAQMGFMMLQCGLALFPLALLHVVAHSLYKAHAFLSAGGAVETVAAVRRPGPVAVPDARAVARAFGAALAAFVVVGLPLGLLGKAPQAIALGAILVFGTAYLIAQGLAGAAPRALAWRTGLTALAVTAAYFLLQTLATGATAGALPPAPAPGGLGWLVMALAVTTFGAVAWAQATFPIWAGHPAAAGLRVHLSNGLYLNAVTDRLLGGWRRRDEGEDASLFPYPPRRTAP